MNKFVLSSLVSGFVLSSGLVSCSKEITTQDVYRAAAPKIVRASESADIISWDQRPQMELDLQDAFDVSESKPARIKIESDCSFGTDHAITNYQQENPSLIYFHQLMPERIFRENTVNNGCSFTLQLFNANGSSRIFKTKTSQFVEIRAGKVSLEGETRAAEGEKLRYMPRKKEAFRARFDNKAPSQASVVCPNFTTRAIAFDNSIDLSAFDYPSEQAQQSRTNLQVCRVLILQNGAIAGYSAQFLIEPSDLQPLKIEWIRSIKTGELSNREFPLVLGQIFDLRKVTFGEVHITNPSSFQRWVKIADNNLSLTATLTLNNASGGQRPTLQFQKTGLGLERTKDAHDWGYLVINPGEIFVLKLVLLTQPMGCRETPVHLKIQPTQAFVFQDLNMHKEVIATNELTIPEMQWSQTLDSFLGPAPSTNCQWPDPLR